MIENGIRAAFFAIFETKKLICFDLRYIEQTEEKKENTIGLSVKYVKTQPM